MVSCLCFSWLVHICVPTNPPYSNIPPSVQGKYMNIIETNSWAKLSEIGCTCAWPNIAKCNSPRRFATRILFPSRFSFKFILDWIRLKLDENLGRDEFIHDCQRCLSFISYAGTCYLWNLHNRVTWSFVYWPSWYNDMRDMFFLIQSLGDLFKRLKWGNSHALSTLQKSYLEPYMSRVEPT